MIDLNKYLSKLQEKIEVISPSIAFQNLISSGLLIDIREVDEVKHGSPINAIRISKGMLEMKIEQVISETSLPIYLMCQSGKRSLIAATILEDMGFSQIYSVDGGFSRWKNEGLPFEIPEILSTDAKERYMRNILVPDIGESGQRKLLNARVLVVGAGGIGSPILYYLAAAGIGTLGIIDHDIVDKTNLQRQIIHSETSVGTSKVNSAKKRVLDLNPTINVLTFDMKLDAHNVESIFDQFDLIIDGTDNFTTRYLVNDACVKLKKPNIHGSVFMFEGQFTTFWPSYSNDAPCYRCLFPSPPPLELAPNCSEAGVLGVLPGLVGTLCATEAINILLGFENMTTQLLVYNAKPIEFHKLKIKKDPTCKYCNCVDLNEYPPYEDYFTSCKL